MLSLLKNLARTSLHSAGLKVQLVNNLPRGSDLCLDLKRSGQSTPGVIFDVGANVGQTAARFARSFPQASIFSFEPIQQTYEQLARNTRKLTNVRAIWSALGSECGSKRIHHQEDTQWNSLNEEANRLGNPEAFDDVQIDTLDRFCSNEAITQIDLLKTDTEGYDLEVLRGASGLLAKRAVRFIYCELTFLEDDRMHTQFAQVGPFLNEYDLHLVCIYEQSVSADLSRFGYCNALFALRKSSSR